MATKPPDASAATAVIRSSGIPGESTAAFLARAVPAFLVSTVFHVIMGGLFWFVLTSNAPARAETELTMIESKVEDKAEEMPLTNEDVGLNPELPTNYDVERIEPVSVPGPVDVNSAVGIVGAPEGPQMNVPPPPGAGSQGQGGGIDSAVAGRGAMVGLTGGMGGLLNAPGGFGGRSGATRERMVETGGGSKESEAAVGRALKWIALHQANDGHWALNGFHTHAHDKIGLGGRNFTCNCDGRGTSNDIAATAFGLLPLLAAGETHKPPTTKGPVHYTKHVEQGLKFLMLKQSKEGDFGGGMYAHGLASIAMCEAYGLTSDPLLKKHAQGAIDFIVRAQHSGGGWRYTPGQPGDTSVVGWQVMALKSGQMSGLTVPNATLKGAEKWLDSVMDNYGGYGYTGPQATPTMTAVGLLCREYLGWSPRNVNLINGVSQLKKTMPGTLNPSTIYYYYYGTQVMHHMGGDYWTEWNAPTDVKKAGHKGMRDILIDTQDKGTTPGKPHQMGSWNPATDAHGSVGGRLMITSLSVLTLEVYYRHLPLYKRDLGAMKPLEPDAK